MLSVGGTKVQHHLSDQPPVHLALLLLIGSLAPFTVACWFGVSPYFVEAKLPRSTNSKGTTFVYEEVSDFLKKKTNTRRYNKKSPAYGVVLIAILALGALMAIPHCVEVDIRSESLGVEKLKGTAYTISILLVTYWWDYADEIGRAGRRTLGRQRRGKWHPSQTCKTRWRLRRQSGLSLYSWRISQHQYFVERS